MPRRRRPRRRMPGRRRRRMISPQAAPGGACLSGSFEVIEGEELLQQVRASMNTKGSRVRARLRHQQPTCTGPPVRKFPIPPASPRPTRRVLSCWTGQWFTRPLRSAQRLTARTATARCLIAPESMPSTCAWHAQLAGSAAARMALSTRRDATAGNRAAAACAADAPFVGLGARGMAHLAGSRGQRADQALTGWFHSCSSCTPTSIRHYSNRAGRGMTSDESQREQLEPSRVVLRLDVWARNSGRVQEGLPAHGLLLDCRTRRGERPVRAVYWSSGGRRPGECHGGRPG